MAEPVDWVLGRLAQISELPIWGKFRLVFDGLAEGPCSACLSLDGPRTKLVAENDESTVRCRLQINWIDLERYVTGQHVLLDLVSTGRLRMSGSATSGLALLFLLKTGETFDSMPTTWQILGRDALSPCPGVEVRCDFEIQPAVSGQPESIPIVINSFNRPTTLARLIEALRRRNYRNLYVIDNLSSSTKLLDFYHQQKLRVYFLDRNVGAYAIWRTRIGQDFVRGYYVYTDSDVVPIEECPDDFLAYFQSLLEVNKDWDKVGFGLKIDDLPDCFAHKQQVIRHETSFWRRPVGNDVYLAAIDTTFALYRPGACGGTMLTAARTGGRYMAHHLPWYADSAHPSPEEAFYLQQIAGYAHWSNLDKKKAAQSGSKNSDPVPGLWK